MDDSRVPTTGAMGHEVKLLKESPCAHYRTVKLKLIEHFAGNLIDAPTKAAPYNQERFQLYPPALYTARENRHMDLAIRFLGMNTLDTPSGAWVGFVPNKIKRKNKLGRRRGLMSTVAHFVTIEIR